MAKTLNQFLESYLKVKNPDEQKFVDKHVVAKHADRNGNDDEVFKGSKVKMIDRRKDRKGYNPGEDEKVYEELKGNQHKIDHNKNGKIDAHDFKLLRGKKKVAEEAEDLEELDTATLQSYRKKARAQGNAIVDKMKMGGGDWSKDQKDTKTLRKRSAGAQMSGKQLVKRGESLKTEEAEELEELSKSTMGAYTKKAAADFSARKPKMGYDGQLKKMQNRTVGVNRALNKMYGEEAEDLEELSNDTLRRYRMKAKSVADHGGEQRTKGRELAGRKSYGGRMAGIEKAKVMAKEEAEQIDELSTDTMKSYDRKRSGQVYSGGGNRTSDANKLNRQRNSVSLARTKVNRVHKTGNTVLKKEEVEQIDEISKGKAMKALQHVASDPDDTRGYTLRKKIGKKWPEMKSHADDAAYVASYGRSKGDPMASFSRDKLADRAKTSYRMTKAGKANKQDLKARFRKEDIELEEKLNMDKASMGDVITDFKDSNAPQFKGKSQDKRRAMAIAAKLTAERGGQPLRKEEKLADLLGDLTESHRRTMLSVFDKLNESNQKKFLEACETSEGVDSMLDFAISHRGE